MAMPAAGIRHPSARVAKAERGGTRLEIRQRASPNHGPRRNGLQPSLVVLHYTAMESAEEFDAAVGPLIQLVMGSVASAMPADDSESWVGEDTEEEE